MPKDEATVRIPKEPKPSFSLSTRRRQPFTLAQHERMMRAAMRPPRIPGLPSLPMPSPRLTAALRNRVRPAGKNPLV